MTKLTLAFVVLLVSCTTPSSFTKDDCVVECDRALKDLADRSVTKCKNAIEEIKEKCFCATTSTNSTKRWKQLRSTVHLDGQDHRIIHTDIRIWNQDSAIPQTIECIYYEGSRSDEYLARKTKTVQGGKAGAITVSIMAYLRNVPQSIKDGTASIRTSCYVREGEL